MIPITLETSWKKLLAALVDSVGRVDPDEFSAYDAEMLIRAGKTVLDRIEDRTMDSWRIAAVAKVLGTIKLKEIP